MPTELLSMAIQVLHATVERAKPSPIAIQMLRDAVPDRAGDPVDDLARYIVERELNGWRESEQASAAGAWPAEVLTL